MRRARNTLIDYLCVAALCAAVATVNVRGEIRRTLDVPLAGRIDPEWSNYDEGTALKVFVLDWLRPCRFHPG